MEFIHLAAIQAEDQGLGYQNRLLFRIRTDLQTFRKQIQNHVVVMGRKTYESIGHPLKNCVNIVLSQTLQKVPEEDVKETDTSFHVCATWQALKELIGEQYSRRAVYIIGGQQVYTDSLPFTERLFLTEVKDPQGPRPADTFYPSLTAQPFRLMRVSEWCTEVDREGKRLVQHRALEYHRV